VLPIPLLAPVTTACRSAKNASSGLIAVLRPL
jgi:hypothetical protein